MLIYQFIFHRKELQIKIISFYTKFIPNTKQLQETDVKKRFIFKPSIYVDENEFERIKKMDKEPNKDLKELLRNLNYNH